MNTLTNERLEAIRDLAKKATYNPCKMHEEALATACDSEVVEEMIDRIFSAEGKITQLLAQFPALKAAEAQLAELRGQAPIGCIEVEDGAIIDYRIPAAGLSNGWHDLFANPVPPAASQPENTFIAHIKETKERVSQWPEWKQNLLSQPYTVPEERQSTLLFDEWFKAVEASDDENWQEPKYLSKEWNDYLSRMQLARGAWEGCRGAMLQSGNSPVVPDGYCIMPIKLTAENGAKGALSGEFHIPRDVTCHECGGEGCEDCSDQGCWEEEIPIGWDIIKLIYKAAVDACSIAAAPQHKGE